MRSRGEAVPGPLEFECLEALWALGEGTVGDVQKEMRRGSALAYTTVMTVLDRLTKKGSLTRRKAGRKFLYQASISPESVRSAAVRDVVNEFFGGSTGALLEYLERKGLPRPSMADVLSA